MEIIRNHFQFQKAFIDAFAKFPQFTFVCRIEGELPPLPDNVKVFDWLPQKDLLGRDFIFSKQNIS